ncbi:MAG: hypothetical protein CXT78_07345 [Thaumarchaeota archaeon]|jgi:hypothetical protein|nr:MAG: hypothetical protein CXT78_07345 [Nitrososphaerota archaeon]
MSSNSSSKELQSSMEDIIKKKQYENFDGWVTNFASNLPNIWNENSAKKLNLKIQNFEKEKNSAIVIGRGPSINKFEHLKLLAESNYQGNIVCSDGILSNALKAGVTPDKFPKFFVVTIDPYPFVKKHYEHEIIKSYGSKIKGIFTVITNPEVVEKARDAEIQIHWLHSLFDYNEGKKSFNNLSALMIRAKNIEHKLPAIQTGGNAGTAAWFISWQILKCSTVALIGINHGHEEDDPLETIIYHNNKEELSEGVDRDSTTFQKLYKKVYNPDFNCICILDPLYQFYSEALKEFISRSPDWLTTINATEGGSIFGDRIKSMKFEKFLEKYEI